MKTKRAPLFLAIPQATFRANSERFEKSVGCRIVWMAFMVRLLIQGFSNAGHGRFRRPGPLLFHFHDVLRRSQNGVGVERDAVDAASHQKTGELGVVAGSLAADTH